MGHKLYGFFFLTLPVAGWTPTIGGQSRAGPVLYTTASESVLLKADDAVAMRARAASLLASRLESAWQETLDAGASSSSSSSSSQSSSLRELLAQSCRWDGDTESVGGAVVVEERVLAIGKFYENSKFAVTSCVALDDSRAKARNIIDGVSTDSYLMDWAFSGTWPLPWRPRIRISGQCIITTEARGMECTSGSGQGGSADSGVTFRVLSMEDRWVAPRSFFRGMLDDQLLPRVGDLLNVYSTPHAEFPEWARVACINNGGGGGGYDVYEAPPCLVLRVSSVLDPANLSDDRECMRGYFLPDHAFTGKLKWRGKTGDDFVTTSPLAVAVEALPRCSESDGNGGAPGGGEEPPRRLTWTIPVPSELCTGLDWERAGMSPVPDLDQLRRKQQQGKGWKSGNRGLASHLGSASIEYVALPARRIAVTPFGLEDTISDEASAARRELLQALTRDGERVVASASSGRPLFSLLQTSVKLAWSKEKKTLGMAIYSAPANPWGKPHFIAAELLPSEKDERE